MKNGDRLPEEALVQLVVSNGLSTTLICTPNHLPELVTGWLFTQGLVENIGDICSLQVCDSNIRVLVQVKQNGAPAVVPSEILTSSGCSGGRVLGSSFRIDGYKCPSTLTVSTARLVQAISAMYDASSVDQELSGLHCAAVVPLDGVTEVIADSDIGRHNAVDKVIGAALTKKLDCGQAVLTTSGRVSSDMVLKGIRAGIPVIATRRSVTTLAAELAAKAGIAVVARLSRGQPVIVGFTDRIIG